MCPEEQSAGAATAEAPVELAFADSRVFQDLLGNHDEHLRVLERGLGVRVDAHGKLVVAEPLGESSDRAHLVDVERVLGRRRGSEQKQHGEKLQVRTPAASLSASS